jgi:hypothetical protein
VRLKQISLFEWLLREGHDCYELRYDVVEQRHSVRVTPVGVSAGDWEVVPKDVWVSPEDEDQWMERGLPRKHLLLELG